VSGGDDDIVVLRQFGNEAEANLAASVLEANGVPARVAADTAGGAFPSLALVFPIRLLVRRADRAVALELLDSPGFPEGSEERGED
jgi:type III secretory pathway lipoprotein EscJ